MSPILTQISVLFLALVVLSVFSVSLPYLPALYTVRVTFGSGSEARGFYSEFTNGTSVCTKAGAAYALTFSSGGTAVTIASNWTRGLVLYPVGKGRFHTAGVTFVALLVTCCGTAPAGVVSGLALLLTFIALWPHVALDQYIWHKMKGTGADTKLGNALALHFLSATLLMIASAGAIRGSSGGRSGGIPRDGVPALYGEERAEGQVLGEAAGLGRRVRAERGAGGGAVAERVGARAAGAEDPAEVVALFAASVAYIGRVCGGGGAASATWSRTWRAAGARGSTRC
ncbi:hypothetical protein FIBSPDRAFT_941435 [Athelia psychrophila]|uniref:Pali-domain-containing protein n=1 Tax=Athelia psychrophila TaxID=1759441 RepID=A0A167U501_9AGAM|nr:hypothetical protein FIBSPDRAFT_941435 [Fibularhizoctonia sp. CBS 109695]